MMKRSRRAPWYAPALPDVMAWDMDGQARVDEVGGTLPRQTREDVLPELVPGAQVYHTNSPT